MTANNKQGCEEVATRFALTARWPQERLEVALTGGEGVWPTMAGHQDLLARIDGLAVEADGETSDGWFGRCAHLGRGRSPLPCSIEPGPQLGARHWPSAKIDSIDAARTAPRCRASNGGARADRPGQVSLRAGGGERRTATGAIPQGRADIEPALAPCGLSRARAGFAADDRAVCPGGRGRRNWARCDSVERVGRTVRLGTRLPTRQLAAKPKAALSSRPPGGRHTGGTRRARRCRRPHSRYIGQPAARRRMAAQCLLSPARQRSKPASRPVACGLLTGAANRDIEPRLPVTRQTQMVAGEIEAQPAHWAVSGRSRRRARPRCAGG